MGTHKSLLIYICVHTYLLVRIPWKSVWLSIQGRSLLMGLCTQIISKGETERVYECSLRDITLSSILFLCSLLQFVSTMYWISYGNIILNLKLFLCIFTLRWNVICWFL